MTCRAAALRCQQLTEGTTWPRLVQLREDAAKRRARVESAAVLQASAQRLMEHKLWTQALADLDAAIKFVPDHAPLLRQREQLAGLQAAAP